MYTEGEWEAQGNQYGEYSILSKQHGLDVGQFSKVYELLRWH